MVVGIVNVNVNVNPTSYPAEVFIREVFKTMDGDFWPNQKGVGYKIALALALALA